MKNRRARLALAVTVSCGASALAASGAHADHTMSSWPEVPTVQDWVAEELRETRAVLQGQGQRSGERAARASAAPKPPSVELLAVYGTQAAWAADVRIGGHVHVLRSRGDVGRADDARGSQSIVADRREGSCLRLRYRATSRRICLSYHVGQEGAS